MPETMPTAYDEVLYPSRAFPQTHPDRLATLATLFGLKPAPVERCRVLELGCGDGSNLIPMAYALPGSEFVGIDLAARPIAAGKTLIDTLALTNISLRAADVMTVTASLGQFDYVIAHGLYSWVPAPVRHKVLSICREHLAPNGVAYVSYNAYPGGRLREMVGEMMRFHVQHLADTSAQMAEARALLKFLSDAQPPTEPYGGLLRAEFERVSAGSDAYVYHDDFAPTNARFYFHEFIKQAAGLGLQFLCEADFFESQDQQFTPEVAATLRQVTGTDRILREQYADFLKSRKFRQTLLCHGDLEVDLAGSAARMPLCSIAASVQPLASPPDLQSPTAVVEFRNRTGQSLASDHPLLKAAMVCLGEAWPRAVAFDELVMLAVAMLNAPAGIAIRVDEARRILGDGLLQVTCLAFFGPSEI